MAWSEPGGRDEDELGDADTQRRESTELAGIPLEQRVILAWVVCFEGSVFSAVPREQRILGGVDPSWEGMRGEDQLDTPLMKPHGQVQPSSIWSATGRSYS